IFSRLALPLFALFVLLSVAVNFVPTPWWGMNSVIRNLPYYSLGAWFGATLMTYVKEVPLRRHLLMASLLTVLAVGAWLFTISLLLSLVSIVVIMKLFYQYEQRFGMRSTSLLNVIGTNTIAIYTTHRILVEIFSLTLLAPMNAARWSPQVEL
ncbi:TPA: acyltransferase family protein, partial [Escherichia coli]